MADNYDKLPDGMNNASGSSYAAGSMTDDFWSGYDAFASSYDPSVDRDVIMDDYMWANMDPEEYDAMMDEMYGDKSEQKDEPPTETVTTEQAEEAPDPTNEAYDNKSNADMASAVEANEAESKRVVLDGSIAAYDPLSYDSLLVNYRAFRQAGGLNSSPFNTWDFPVHNFFRILFHFTDSIRDDKGIGIGTGAGLLHPSWIGMTLPSQKEMTEGVTDLIYWNNSSAWSYLMQNAEYIRANLLKQFIELLSNINTESPWYFQSVKGIDAAIARKQITENFEFKDRGKITIECLDDSTDQRIGTLLDLYRASTWSWQTKRAIIPANLRKFDMTIVIISSPIHNLHTPSGGKIPNPMGDVIGATSPTVSNLGEDYASASASSGPNIHRASYKMIELHNCEIDYNSSASGYDTIDNKEGFGHKYNIDIYFDDAVEVRYNEFLEGLAEISDLIGTDTLEPIYTENTSDDSKQITVDTTDAGVEKGNDVTEKTTQTQDPASETTPASTENTTGARVGTKSSKFGSLAKKAGNSVLDKISDKIGDPLITLKDRTNTKGFLRSVVDELEEYGASWVSSKINRILVGNLFGLSVSKVARQVGQALNGQVFATIHNVNDAKRSTYNGKGSIVPPYSNIFEDTPPNASDVIELGNIFRGQTIAQS